MKNLEKPKLSVFGFGFGFEYRFFGVYGFSFGFECRFFGVFGFGFIIVLKPKPKPKNRFFRFPVSDYGLLLGAP
jgi:hypothetical protein